MRWVLNKYLVSIVLVAFGVYIFPADLVAKDKWVAGKRTADEAASFRDDAPGVTDVVPSLKYAAPLSNSFAQTDTTEFEFPEKEETHLARDITIFVIASAFIAYFIIKVFLEGDKEEGETTDDGGKDYPPI
jgi:hypothetical protein